MSDVSPSTPQRTCFVARPLSISEDVAALYGGDTSHWDHVEEHLILPALSATGYTHVPTPAEGAVLIHEHVIEKVYNEDLVIADFSQLNANVLFEAGVRTSVNKPLLVIAETGTKLPFDMSGVNTWFYDPALRAWDLPAMVAALVRHIEGTSPTGNALWSKFGARLQAEELAASNPGDATAVLLNQMSNQVQQLWDATQADRPGQAGRHEPSTSYQSRATALLSHRLFVEAADRLVTLVDQSEQPDEIAVEISTLVDQLVMSVSNDGPAAEERKYLLRIEALLSPEFAEPFERMSRAWSRVKARVK